MSPLSKQEVFTKAFIGLRDQDFRRSLNSDASLCAYRGANNCRCAVGHLIPDDLYDPDMDAAGLSYGLLTQRFPAVAALFSATPSGFLEELQHTHDDSDTPHEMEARLRQLAINHNLEVPA